jgi:hypothetical protein
MKSEDEKKSIDVPLTIWLNDRTGNIHMNVITTRQLQLAGKIK